MSAILYFLRLGIFKLQASYIYLFLLLLQRFLISIPTNRSMKISLFPGLRISLTYERTELVTKKKKRNPVSLYREGYIACEWANKNFHSIR